VQKDNEIQMFWEQLKIKAPNSKYVLSGIDKTKDYSDEDWDRAQTEFNLFLKELVTLIRYRINPIHGNSKILVTSLIEYLDRWFFTPDEQYLYFLKESMHNNKDYWFFLNKIDQQAPEFMYKALDFHSSSSLLDFNQAS
jgi:hypothetical protein